MLTNYLYIILTIPFLLLVKLSSYVNLYLNGIKKTKCLLVFVMALCASVYLCLVVTCWERADLLGLVCGEIVTFSLVLWVRCGT